MSDLARRVAARFSTSPQGAVEKTAAHLPVRWFKEQKEALKAALKTPLGRSNPSDWRWLMQDKVLPFFDKFQRDFDAVVGLDAARDSIKNRVEMAKTYVDGVASKLPDDPYVNFADPKDYLRWFARHSIFEKMQEGVDTLGDLFRYTWTIDANLIDRLVDKTIKAASPEELASLTSDGYSSRKYDFLAKIGFAKAALRALKRSKLEWDPNKWVDRIFEMLEANYSEKALNENVESYGFREFNLQGIKVIIDDKTVDNDDVKNYVKYLVEAKALLKRKKLDKAWHGNVFIRCKDCGGTNPNTGGGTGGWYEIAKDTVTIFQRPGSFLVELMVHELGHRYWFKEMSSGQRARFEDLVKVHTKHRPYKAPDVRLFRDNEVRDAKSKLREAEKYVAMPLKRAENYNVESLTPLARNTVSSAGWEFGHEVISIITSIKIEKDLGADVDALKDTVYNMKTKLIEHFDEITLMRDQGRMLPWLREARHLVDQMTIDAGLYLEAAFKRHNELAMAKLDPESREWQESLDKNPAPVPSVSNYGQSNIDEAFAEVFAHYVLEYDITRDQLESFRSVLSSDGIVERVRRRFLASQDIEVESWDSHPWLLADTERES